MYVYKGVPISSTRVATWFRRSIVQATLGFPTILEYVTHTRRKHGGTAPPPPPPPPNLGHDGAPSWHASGFAVPINNNQPHLFNTFPLFIGPYLCARAQYSNRHLLLPGERAG